MKILKPVIGIVLAPAALAAAWATFAALGPVLGTVRVTFPLLAGALVFTLAHLGSALYRGKGGGGSGSGSGSGGSE